jgi:uncharacterized delta-60 repeat protein
VKYDSNGTIIWQDTLDNGEEDYAEDVTVDNSNNIIVTGYSMIGDDYDYFTVKYDSSGAVLWQDILDHAGLYDIARGVAVDNGDNIIVTGYCDIDGDCVYLTVKYNPEGVIMWVDTLNYGPFDSAFGVATDNSNNIIVTGYTSDGVDNDYLTVKYDAGGGIIWERTLDIHQFDQAYGVAVDKSNNIIVTGCSGNALDDYDYFTVKYGSDGSVCWQDSIDNNNSDDVAYSVTVDSGNNIYITGYSLELSGDYDYFVVKCDSTGSTLWQDTYTNGNDDISYGIAVDGSNNIIVTGGSYIESNRDFFTIKYTPVTGIAIGSNPSTDSDVILCYPYPNPFSEMTRIELRFSERYNHRMKGYNLEESYSAVNIKIYNSLGMLVWKYDETCKGQLNHIVWNGTNSSGRKLSDGAYFLLFETKRDRGVSKLIIAR